MSATAVFFPAEFVGGAGFRFVFHLSGWKTSLFDAGRFFDKNFTLFSLSILFIKPRYCEGAEPVGPPLFFRLSLFCPPRSSPPLERGQKWELKDDFFPATGEKRCNLSPFMEANHRRSLRNGELFLA